MLFRSLAVEVISDCLMFLEGLLNLSFLLSHSDLVALLELLLLSLKVLDGLNVLADSLLELIDVLLELSLGLLVGEELPGSFLVVSVALILHVLLSVGDGVLKHDDLAVLLVDAVLLGSDLISSLLELGLVESLAFEDLFVIWGERHVGAILDDFANLRSLVLVSSAQVNNLWLILGDISSVD